MATKIKRCLYIGLGGTGMNALLHTKKMFVENYGEVPPMIGFLGIDTDGGAYKKQLETTTGQKIALTANEQLPITVKDARPIYEVNKESFGWIPAENLYALSSMMLGAGQIRTNGRFAFTVNYQNIVTKVQNILNAITNAKIISNQQYDLLGTEVEIHMVFSICGGTGAGIFLNMATLLWHCAPECKLTGYAVLPGVFKAMSNHAMTKVQPNAYGSIQDLDYLMHLDLGTKSVMLDYIKESVEVKERPFNSIVFIDNKNVNNDTYSQIDDLSEMASLALVIAAGELSVATASVSDNLEKEIREGNMNIENKRAWGAGMGVCELIYKGERLSHIYAIKAAKLLIERLLNSCEDIDVLVNNWIDSPEVNIRENEGHDHVIDAIAEPFLKYDFTTINDYKDASAEAEAYLQLSRLKDEDLKANCRNLAERVEKQLHLLIAQHINRECGISTAEKLLLGINAQIEIFEREMNQEKKEYQDREPALKSAMEIAITDLSEADRKFFVGAGKKRELADDVMAATKNLALCRMEITRRSNATTFFNGVRALLLKYLDRVRSTKSLMKKVYDQFTSDLAQYQNRVDTMYKTFEIDLAQNSLKSLTVNPDEIQIPEFVRRISEKDHILDFDQLDASVIANYLMQYTLTLPSAIKKRNTSIDEIINDMSDDEFNQLFTIAIKKATPLFRYNYRGHTPKQQVGDFFYIGVPDKNNSRLVEMAGISNLISGSTSINYTSTGMADRIVIYRQIGVVPAYTLEDLPIYQKEYEMCNVFCNFDANLKTRMDREGFELNPKKSNDDDLLDLWVKGFIFKMIKNENNTYYFQSESEGDILDDNWVELSSFRDEAFETFKKYRKLVRGEFNNKIELLIQKQGEDATLRLIEEVKKDYLENFSQIKMTKDQIRQRGNEKILDLIKSELNYIKSIRS